MLAALVIDAELVDWIVAVLALGSLLVAIVALWQTSKSNATAREANDLAKEANLLSERTTRLQEDEGKVRLVVKPRMMMVLGEEADGPRPVVDVINLSSFPVTITGVHWRQKDGGFLHWKNPDVALPFGAFPVRLPSRESMTTMGNGRSFPPELIVSVQAAIACTACGEQIEGMTEQFLEHVATVQAELEKNTSTPQA